MILLIFGLHYKFIYMANPKQIIIVETEKEIKNLIKKSIPFIAQRLRVLLVIKQHEKHGISKRDVSKLTGVDPNSVQNWRTLYVNKGIDGILRHNRIGFKPSVFSEEEHQKIKDKLNDPQNGLQGYVELKEWMEAEFKKEFQYRTIVNYCVVNFKSKVKVARKSHEKKDEAAIEAFKKTSAGSVKSNGAVKKKSTNQ